MLFAFCQLSARGDTENYFRSRVTISAINGLWETDALTVIQIGTFRGDKSTKIDSIIKKRNGDVIIIRDILSIFSDASAEWEISRKAKRCVKRLEEETWSKVTEVHPIEMFQGQIRDGNSSSISGVQRYLHIYTPEKKWMMYDLVTFPMLDKNPKTCEEWEDAFKKVFKTCFDD